MADQCEDKIYSGAILSQCMKWLNLSLQNFQQIQDAGWCRQVLDLRRQTSSCCESQVDWSRYIDVMVNIQTVF